MNTFTMNSHVEETAEYQEHLAMQEIREELAEIEMMETALDLAELPAIF